METVFTRLDRDWADLVRRPSTASKLREACALAGAATPAGLVPTVRRAAPEHADVVLASLARCSAAGSDAAARALLQLLLPGTCRLASKWWALGTTEERAAAAIAAVYDRIRRYPIDRRPSKIAANILLDANQDLARAARKLTAEAQRSVPTEPERLFGQSHEEELSAAEELRDVLVDAVATGRVPEQWAALIVATRIEGDSLPSIALRTGSPLRTLQWRRRSAEAALAAGAAA